MTTRTSVMAFTGIGLVATTVLTGCGSSWAGDPAASGDSKTQLVSAFEALGKSSGVGLELTLDSSPEDLKKINAAQPESDRMSAADVKTEAQILDGALTVNVSAQKGKTLADGPGASSGSVLYRDKSLVDAARVDGFLYLRADSERIADIGGFGLDEMRTFFADVDPSISEPVNAVLDSRWVSLDLVKSANVLREKKLLDELTGMSLPDASKGYALLQSLQVAVENDATVAPSVEGYRVTVPVKKVAQAVQDDLVALTGDDDPEGVRADIAGIPEKNAVFDVTVEDGRLTGVNFDLVQFLDRPVEGARMALNLRVDPQAEVVRAPTGATEIDVQAVIASLRGQGLFDGTAVS